jgi:hypothetical protein
MRSAEYGYYYERRPHQYDDRHDILQQLIVSAPSLIKSFVSTVLEEPHKVHYYYGTLLSDYNKNRSTELFSDDDYPGLYFAAHHITSKTRVATARDTRLNEWSFHIALLVKRALAPELRKGAALNDKQFLQILNRIDAGFDAAFRLAADVVRNAGLSRYDNRIGSVTMSLVAQFAKAVTIGKFAVPVIRSQPILEFHRPAGRYAGAVERVDLAKRQIVIQYGPFRVVADADDDRVLQLPAGARLLFTVAPDRIVASAIHSDG